MTQPLALVFYEKLLPGTQLVNRLQDIGYRVTAVNGLGPLINSAVQDKPMLVFADLECRRGKVADAISHLRQEPVTSHLPIIAFAKEKDTVLQTAARDAGATLVVSDSAVLTHLQQFLDQALHID